MDREAIEKRIADLEKGCGSLEQMIEKLGRDLTATRGALDENRRWLSALEPESSNVVSLPQGAAS
jgi:uncharacterized coiled-coil protein SlyX